MKAISTTFYGPTDTRGARIVARAEGVKSLSVPYDYGNPYPHADAARKLAARCKWAGHYIGAGMPDGKTRVFVDVSEDRETFDTRPEVT